MFLFFVPSAVRCKEVVTLTYWLFYGIWRAECCHALPWRQE